MRPKWKRYANEKRLHDERSKNKRMVWLTCSTSKLVDRQHPCQELWTSFHLQKAASMDTIKEKYLNISTNRGNNNQLFWINVSNKHVTIEWLSTADTSSHIRSVFLRIPHHYTDYSTYSLSYILPNVWQGFRLGCTCHCIQKGTLSKWRNGRYRSNQPISTIMKKGRKKWHDKFLKLTPYTT